MRDGFPPLPSSGPRFPESRYLSDVGKAMREQILANADLFREHAREGEELGVLAPATVQIMHQIGLFKISLPAEIGGSALGARDTVEIVDALGRVDASAGWTVIVSTATRNTLAFPKKASEEVFANVDTWVGPLMFGASVFSPQVGKGRKVDGGFMVEGKWSFGSGCRIAAWGSVGIDYPDDKSGEPRRAMAILSPDQFSILDDWKVMGLSATSSNSVKTSAEVFVPDHRVVQMDELMMLIEDLRGKYKGVAYMHSPVGTMLVTTAAFAALAAGMAKGALAAFIDQAKKRAPFNLPYKTMSEMSTIQSVAGKARAAINAADAVILRHADEIDRRALAGEDFFPGDEPEITMDLVHQIHECLRVIDGLQLALGSSTVALNNPIQRFVRDVHVLATHGAFRMDPMGEINGRDMFGLAPFPMLAALGPPPGKPPMAPGFAPPPGETARP